MIALDTHAAVWWANGDGRLSAAAEQAIDEERQSEHGHIALSAISAWEIDMLVQRGRLELGVSVDRFLSGLEAVSQVRFHAIDRAIALDAVRLPGEFHRDPADRFIVATARLLHARLITADTRMQAYPHVTVLW